MIAVDADGSGGASFGNVYFIASMPEPATAMLLAIPAFGLVMRRPKP